MIDRIFAVLEITDGTNTVDLLNWFRLLSWVPNAPAPRQVWHSTPFGESRKLVLSELNNTSDKFEIQVKTMSCVDELIRMTQDLRRLLENAVNYWITKWSNEPVWIKARGQKETNSRYAVIMDYLAPHDSDPYGALFFEHGVIENFELTLEHLPWQADEPGTGTCIETAGYGCWCWPSSISFNEGIGGTGTEHVNFGSGANIDDLPLADYTIDFWIYARTIGTLGDWTSSFICQKGSGWNIYLSDNSNGFVVFLNYGAPFSYTICSWSDIETTIGLSFLGNWIHVAYEHDAILKYGVLYFNGYVVPRWNQAGAGAYNSDAAASLLVGNGSTLIEGLDGMIGWYRLSSGKRFGVAFPNAVPPKCRIPDNDPATELLAVCEGTGLTAYDRSGNGNNGTLTNGPVWACDCCE